MDAISWYWVQANWSRLRGAIQSEWSLLSAEQIIRIAGRRQGLVRALQERYMLTEPAAAILISDWLHRQDVLEKQRAQLAANVTIPNLTLPPVLDGSMSHPARSDERPQAPQGPAHVRNRD